MGVGVKTGSGFIIYKCNKVSKRYVAAGKANSSKQVENYSDEA